MGQVKPVTSSGLSRLSWGAHGMSWRMGLRAGRCVGTKRKRRVCRQGQHQRAARPPERRVLLATPISLGCLSPSLHTSTLTHLQLLPTPHPIFALLPRPGIFTPPRQGPQGPGSRSLYRPSMAHLTQSPTTRLITSPMDSAGPGCPLMPQGLSKFRTTLGPNPLWRPLELS